MSQKNVKNNVLVTLLTAVYLFVALFSQHFHNHGSGFFFKDFHFVKSEKSVSVSNQKIDFTDCLSCHLISEGNSLLPQEFSFDFKKVDLFKEQVFSYKQRFSSLVHHTFYLRGPPQIFI